jgi:hypothetical protein
MPFGWFALKSDFLFYARDSQGKVTRRGDVKWKETKSS